MAKILSLERANPSLSELKCSALIHGKTWDFVAKNLDHCVEKILHRDKMETGENIREDIALNYPNINP